MQSYDEFIKQLNEGYVFEFIYMEKEHKVMSFDKKNYVLIKYTTDNHNNREEKSIVPRKVLKEMWKGITNIIYSY